MCPRCGASAWHRWVAYAVDRLPLPTDPPDVLLVDADKVIERLCSQRGWRVKTAGGEGSADLVISFSPVVEVDGSVRYDGLIVEVPGAEPDQSEAVPGVLRPEQILGPWRAGRLGFATPGPGIIVRRPRRSADLWPWSMAWPLRSRPDQLSMGAPTDDPVFIIGAPRSGTTFLGRVLNLHDRLFITNEIRLMALFNRMMIDWVNDDWLVHSHRGEFSDYLERHLASFITGFYRELGAGPGVRWGDKHPHYADPLQDLDCLATIDRIFPRSQFIHLMRDPRDVAASIIAKGWVDCEGAVDVWSRHVRHGRDFGRIVGSGRYLEVRYEELLRDGATVVGGLFDFLGLPMTDSVDGFLSAQQQERTPFSAPTTALLGEARTRFDELESRLRGIEVLLAETGYQ